MDIAFGGDKARASTTGRSVALGAYVAGAPWKPAEIDGFSSMIGTPPSVVMWYQDWAHSGVKEFDPQKMDTVSSCGAMPMVTWEPWDYLGKANQPYYSLQSINAGKHDAHIRQWARDATAWGKPFYLRFAHEMNGNWNSWSPGVNGNIASQYVSVWRRVRGIFGQEGATNVRWVWSPNVESDSSVPFSKVYPGDAHVDWIGIDGYNWGTTQSWSSWTGLAEVFGLSYGKLVDLTDKPIMIAETASTELGGDKAAWIRQGFLDEVLFRLPRVRAIIYFHENKETDWRVDSSPASLAAYSEMAASSFYQGRLP